VKILAYRVLEVHNVTNNVVMKCNLHMNLHNIGLNFDLMWKSVRETRIFSRCQRLYKQGTLFVTYYHATSNFFRYGYKHQFWYDCSIGRCSWQ